MSSSGFLLFLSVISSGFPGSVLLLLLFFFSWIVASVIDRGCKFLVYLEFIGLSILFFFFLGLVIFGFYFRVVFLGFLFFLLIR